MDGFKILVGEGANVAAWDSEGMGALHIAVDEKNYYITKVCLVSCGDALSLKTCSFSLRMALIR